MAPVLQRNRHGTPPVYRDGFLNSVTAYVGYVRPVLESHIRSIATGVIACRYLIPIEELLFRLDRRPYHHTTTVKDTVGHEYTTLSVQPWRCARANFPPSLFDLSNSKYQRIKDLSIPTSMSLIQVHQASMPALDVLPCCATVEAIRNFYKNDKTRIQLADSCPKVLKIQDPNKTFFVASNNMVALWPRSLMSPLFVCGIALTGVIGDVVVPLHYHQTVISNTKTGDPKLELKGPCCSHPSHTLRFTATWPPPRRVA